MERFKDYVEIPESALDDLTGSELKLLCIMVYQWANMGDEETGWYSNSIKNLSKDSGMSNKTVIKCINSMVEKKYLSVRKDKKHGANTYQLNQRFWKWA